MATVATIKDPVLLDLAKQIVRPDQEWTSAHHANLVWRCFRNLGFGNGLKPEELAKKALEWQAHWDNGSLGYSSNLAKRLAESGVCAKSQPERAKLEYS